MLSRIRALFFNYPNQFWLMFVGMLVSTIGASMIWPFLLVYVSERLNTQLTATATLLTLNSGMGLVASFAGGPFVDRIGRKWIMVASLGLNGAVYFFMGNAHTFSQFAILLALSGSANPLYRIGADAMMADLVEPEKRVEAYAMLRLSNNIGVAIGPAIGGFIAATSFSLAFYFAASGMVIYSLLLVLFAKETLPSSTVELAAARGGEHTKPERFGGYLSVISDLPYMGFILAFTLVSMSAMLVWVLLPVYATENYDVPLKLYGLIPTTNAIMVVTLQLLVTRITGRYPVLPIIAIGAMFYTIAVGAVTFMHGFWGFLGCMVVMTIGELIIAPTSSTYVANRAPTDKRGRYMSLYALTWGVALGIAPVLGGFLNDNIGPSAIWIGGSIAAAVSVGAFVLLSHYERRQPTKTIAAVTSEISH
jgi:MFS family permease